MACMASSTASPVAETLMDVPFEAASIIRPIIEVAETSIPSFSTRISVFGNCSAHLTNFADAAHEVRADWIWLIVQNYKSDFET